MGTSFRFRFALVFAASLTLILIAYLQGISGALYYDDYGNLEKLTEIKDLQSAWVFVTSGFAGPLGRPIALASFLPHFSAWPDNSATILLVNVLIHLINASLLVLLGTQLLRLSKTFNPDDIPWAALAAAVLWASIPLLASTSLIAIQRMTGLAATFTLLGLIGFISAQTRFHHRPWLAFVTSMSALGLGTLLGIFTKESAALTPVFALVISILFLDRTPAGSVQRILRNSVLVTAFAILLYYLSPWYRDWFHVVDYRGWSPWERLQTQSVILWHYLRLAAFPLPTAFSPFGDAYPNHAGTPIVWIATSAWIILIASVIWLYKVKKIIWPIFALAWFFTGHLLESTTIALELRFEHRNYLAMYGMALALSVGTFSIKGALARLLPALFVGYIVMQIVVLFAVTTIWGKPVVAANTWAERNPGSSRSVTHLILLDTQSTGVDVDEANYRIIQRQRQEYNLHLLDRTSSHCPDCLGTQLDALNYSCELEAHEKIRQRLETVTTLAKEGRGKSTTLFSTIDSLFRLRDRTNVEKCVPLIERDLLPLVQALIENNYFSKEHLKTRLMFLAAALSEDLKDVASRDRYLEQAEQISPYAMPVLQYQVYSSLAENRKDDALAAISRRRHLSNRGPSMTDESLDQLEAEVLEN